MKLAIFQDIKAKITKSSDVYLYKIESLFLFIDFEKLISKSLFLYLWNQFPLYKWGKKVS